MTLGEAVKAMQEGKVVTRDAYRASLVIFMQIPALISREMVPTMKSLPNDMKILLDVCQAGVKYRDQFICYDFDDEVATYAAFDGEDINATDWKIVNPLAYNPYED